jgi:hypothetical protein
MPGWEADGQEPRMATNSFADQAADVARTTARAVLLLYLAACLTPAIDCGPSVPSSDPGFPDFDAGWHWGLEILLFGWAGGNNGVPWSANVFLAIGLIGLRARWFRVAAASGSIAIVLGLSTWWVYRYSHCHLLVGYYLWQGSLTALCLGASWAYRRTRDSEDIAAIEREMSYFRRAETNTR